MTKKERYERLIAYFEKERPQAETELVYHDPFQLLVAVILSARQKGQYDYSGPLCRLPNPPSHGCGYPR